MVSVLVVAIVVALMIVAVARQPDRGKRTVLLRRVGFGLTALFAFFFGAFVIGETFADPGGWKAAGLVAAWAVPLAALTALSWFRPGWAVYVCTVLTAAVIGASIWFALNPEGWRSFENRHGPIRAIITFVLVVAIALLGLKRTAAAGILLLAVGIIPVAVSSLGSFLGFTSLSIVSAAPVMTGVLYLVSAHMAGRPAPPAGLGTGPQNGRRRRDHGQPPGDGSDVTRKGAVVRISDIITPRRMAWIALGAAVTYAVVGFAVGGEAMWLVILGAPPLLLLSGILWLRWLPAAWTGAILGIVIAFFGFAIGPLAGGILALIGLAAFLSELPHLHGPAAGP